MDEPQEMSAEELIQRLEALADSDKPVYMVFKIEGDDKTFVMHQVASLLAEARASSKTVEGKTVTRYSGGKVTFDPSAAGLYEVALKASPIDAKVIQAILHP
jgi:hypothetical protein